MLVKIENEKYIMNKVIYLNIKLKENLKTQEVKKSINYWKKLTQLYNS